MLWVAEKREDKRRKDEKIQGQDRRKTGKGKLERKGKEKRGRNILKRICQQREKMRERNLGKLRDE